MTSGSSRTISYTAFNKPATIAEGLNTLTFSHDPEHTRFKQVDQQLGTTLYLNGFGILAEKLTSSLGVVQWNDYLFAGGEMIGAYFERPASSNFTRYFHSDSLGSIVALTDETGALAESESYDPWGKRRYPNGTDDTSNSLTSSTTRGFTSADPTVESPFSTQGWNRYSYVGNNPLAHGDPTGFCFLGCFWKPIFHAIGQIFRVPIVSQVFVIAAVVALCPTTGGACAILVGSASSAFTAGVSSGKIGEAFKAGLVSAATAAAFYGVGEATDFHGADMSKFLTGDHFANIAGHALVGCLSATASGGRCGAGALSAGLSGFAGPVVAGLGGTGGLVASTALGGVGSVLGGGKFENGAITGAFGYLFNAVAGTYDRATGKLTLVDLEDGRSVTADYLSGGKFGGPVPPGTYDILERAGKDEFRLEARDATYGDDHEDSSG